MSAFSPRQMFALDEACKPIAEAFDATPYLVGTALDRGGYRDVDVRLILDDTTYARLVGVAGPQLAAFLGLAIGEYLAARTGMPIDFQVQQQSAANERHDGPRNPLGLRTLDNYRGDAAPEASIAGDTPWDREHADA
ncbi:hypothetical protein ACF044_10725 [Microbacterium sp. NPDC016588]